MGDNMTEATEWMLAVRDRADKAAFAKIFAHFGPRLKAMLMRGGMSAAEAEDVVQDAMLSVWRKAAQFDPARAPVSGWIYQIARNRQIDVLRKERRPIPEALKAPEIEENDAPQILAIEQESAQLRAALGGLSADQREIVERAYLGELSHREIQAETGLPLGTIKSRIRLGLEKLRHEMKGIRAK